MTDNLPAREIAKQLAAAEADLTLWQPRNAAEDNVKRLAAKYERAKEAEAKEAEAKAAAAQEARFAGLKEISVTEIKDPMAPDHLPKSLYHIRYTREAWVPSENTNLPQEKIVTGGFHALPPEVFEYLVERCPSAIPASILDLAPGDPHAAFDAYFLIKRRGYLS